ncbi:hypothetical protein MY11210_000914 [Beauveria gryllotalpidicola]
MALSGIYDFGDGAQLRCFIMELQLEEALVGGVVLETFVCGYLYDMMGPHVTGLDGCLGEDEW